MFNSGIPEIDRQHAELFKILNRIKKYINTDEEKKECEIFLSDLKEYIQYHFAFEEKLMKDCNFYDFKNHSDVHSDFINLVDEAIIDYKLTGILQNKIIVFVEDWFTYHIEVEEELFKDFLVPRLFSSSGKTPVS